MISEIKQTYDPGTIYLVNEDITTYHESDAPINGKTLHVGTPVIYVHTMQKVDSDKVYYIVRDYTGQLWYLESKEYLDKNPVHTMPPKRKISFYKMLFSLRVWIPITVIWASILAITAVSLHGILLCVLLLSYFFALCFVVCLSKTPNYLLCTNEENLQELEVLLAETGSEHDSLSCISAYDNNQDNQQP